MGWVAKIMLEALALYGIGVVSGLLTAWFVMHTRQELSPSMSLLAREAAAQAVVIRAMSDVTDHETKERMAERANELFEEYDLPGSPEFVYDPGE